MTQTGQETISVVLTGSGGAGVMTAGQTLLDAAASLGLYGLMTRSTGPQIRGGEAAALLRFGRRPVLSHGDRFDLLVALDFENISRFGAEIPLGASSVVIADPAAGDPPEFVVASGARIVHVELAKLAKTIPGGRISMVALGALAQMIGLPESAIVGAVAASVGKKKPDAIVTSEKAVALGAAAAATLTPGARIAAPDRLDSERWSITGNEATGYGAIKGGIRFVAGYPITPATEILEWMAPTLRQCGGVLVQAEDELASINMIIGSSFGGAPSLTATAGPGLSLMIESLGLAVASETPLVVVDVMRSGPSTGIATKSEQSDLNIAVNGLHGDAPHVVVAPTDVSDCLLTAQWATHLAESLQTPVIMLSDQSIGQARAIIDRPEDVAFTATRDIWTGGESPYLRYGLTDSGVSAMAIPGTPGGQHTADGLTHNERGTPSSQAHDHVAQLDKRQRKLENFDYSDHWAEIDGDGEIAVVTWGSSTAPIREAIAAARDRGAKIKLIALRLIAPAQPQKFAAALAGVKRVLVIEQSHSGQFWRYLRAHYDLPGEVTPIFRSGPLPFRPGEIGGYLAHGGL